MERAALGRSKETPASTVSLVVQRSWRKLSCVTVSKFGIWCSVVKFVANVRLTREWTNEKVVIKNQQEDWRGLVGSHGVVHIDGGVRVFQTIGGDRMAHVRR